MARKLRIEFEGAIYHVTCRMIGNWQTEKTCLFKDEADRKRFVDQLADRVEQFGVRLFLFVCMSNHFHLVFETPGGGNCSKFMQSLLTAYTVYYNLRHERHGHLLAGRYKAKLVEGTEYLLALSRYVHLNPVQVSSIKRKPIEEKIKKLRSYRWSSYPSYIGRRKAIDFIDYDPMLALLGCRRHERRKRYRELVESGLAEEDKDFKAVLKASPRSIGSDDFNAWVDELYDAMIASHKRPEDVSFRHISPSLDADAVLEVLADVFKVKCEDFRQRRRNSPLRAIAAQCLMKYAGLNQRLVAEYLCAGTGSAISKQIAGLSEVLSKEKKLSKLFKRAGKLLDAQRKEMLQRE